MDKSQEEPAPASPASPAASPPRHNVIRRIYEWVLGWAEHRAAVPALFVLAAAEAIFFPIPPDVLLIALVLGARTRWAYYAAVCSVGSLIGGVGGYYLGYAASDLATAIVRFYGQAELQAKLTQTFSEHSFAAIWIAGLTPIPYKVFTITAGLCHETISLGQLMAASATSRPLRFFGLALLLFGFGEPAKRFIDRYFNLLTVLCAAGIILGFIVLKKLL